MTKLLDPAPLFWVLMVAIYAKKLGDLDASAESYRDFVARSRAIGSAIEPWVPIERAVVCEALGRYAEAVSLFRLAIEDNPGRAAWLSARAADASLKSGLDRQTIREVFREAILLNPDDRDLVLRYGNAVYGKSAIDEFIAALLEIQALSNEIIGSVILELVRWRGLGTIYHLLPDLPRWIEVDPIYQALHHTVNQYAHAKPIENAIADVLRDITDTKLQVFFTIMRPLRPVYLYSSDANAVSGLAASGVDLRRYGDVLAEHMFCLSGFWAEKLDTVTFATPYARHRAHDHERFVSYQDRIIAQKDFRCPDPFDPCRFVSACDSFCRWDRTVYTFYGQHVFHVVTGDSASEFLGIYIPSIDVILHVREGLPAGLGPLQFPWCQAVFLKRLLDRYDDALAAFTQSCEARPKSLIGCVGSVPNVAHELWNTLSGVERLQQGGLLTGLASIAVFGSEFYGSVHQLFPETQHLPVTHHPARVYFDPAPFRLDSLVVPIGGWFVVKELRQRIAGNCAVRMSETARGWVHRIRSEKISPLVWFGIRSNDKAWSGQVSGILHVMTAILRAFPMAGFVIDGFSLPIGEDFSSADWVGERRALNALAEQIVTGAANPDRVFNLVDDSLADATMLSCEITAYVCPLGTSQHKAAWISGKPGLIYGSPQWERAPVEARPGSFEVEGIPLPIYLPMGSIQVTGDRNYRGLNDERVFLDNLEIAPTAISGILIGLISALQRDFADTSREHP